MADALRCGGRIGLRVWLLKLRKGFQIDVPWIAPIAGLAAMIYMSAMSGGLAWAPISYTAAGWFSGELCGRRDNGWLPTAIAPVRGGATAAPDLSRSKPIAYNATGLMRTTLGLMAAGMAYMFAAVQLMR